MSDACFLSGQKRVPIGIESVCVYVFSNELSNNKLTNQSVSIKILIVYAVPLLLKFLQSVRKTFTICCVYCVFILPSGLRQYNLYYNQFIFFCFCFCMLTGRRAQVNYL